MDKFLFFLGAGANAFASSELAFKYGLFDNPASTFFTTGVILIIAVIGGAGALLMTETLIKWKQKILQLFSGS